MPKRKRRTPVPTPILSRPGRPSDRVVMRMVDVGWGRLVPGVRCVTLVGPGVCGSPDPGFC